MSQANREEDNLPARPEATERPAEGNPGLQDQDKQDAKDATDKGASNPAADTDAGDDPRDDPMAPPAEPCECFCLHCGRTFMSDQIWFQKVKGARDGFPGFWMCPTPNCDGAGFTFDIFPTDPNHPANDGWHYDDGDEGEEGEWEEDEGDEEVTGDEEDEDGDLEDEAEGPDSSAEWDPEESKYKAMDEWEEDDDLEGEEWKLGLQPGERPKVQAPPPGVEPRNQAEQEALYDEPDRRPRELDWSDRDDRPYRGNPGSGSADNDAKPGQAGDWFDEDDIPF